MRKSVFTILLLFFAASFTCMAQSEKTTASATPGIQITETTHDFGTVQEGPDYTYVFKVKNTGNAPLIINKVNTPCGCTSPKWSQEPILPGKTGEVTATYHSAGRIGEFAKTLSIESNLGEGKDQYVTIRGQVKAATANAAGAGAAKSH